MATFTNQATLSYNGNVTNSNITTGELVAVLSAQKTAVMDDYTARDDVTYVISITNSGPMAYSDLTLTDNLGAYSFGAETLVPLTYVENSLHYYVNGIEQAAPSVVAGPPMVISGISVPANGSVMLIYEASVNEFAPLAVDGTITNEATVSGASLSYALAVTETITTQETANLTVNKSMNPTVVTENGQITYTFTIQNSGNAAATASDDVILTDTFNPILDIQSVTFNGAAWSQPANYTYDETTGEFETSVGQITVPAATYTQDAVNGNWVINPGVSVLTITGTL